MGGKFKLSDTMQFLTGKLNAVTGGEVNLRIELDDEEVATGSELRARAIVRSPEKDREVDHVQISLKGQVQRDGKWEDFVQSAEVAHDTSLPADHEFIVPIVVMIPADAVLTEDGATWSIYARAHLGRKFDPQTEISFNVVRD